MRSLYRKIRFYLERTFLEGSWAQLFIVIAIIGLVSLIGGFSAHLSSDQFDHWSSAVWWAFLRLSDPGYLGDDQGTLIRVISTVLTVAGYVLFLGAMVALMTQWMWRQIRSLEEGRTPLSLKGHVVIAGMDHRTPELIREMLLSSERLSLFLRRLRRSKLSVVVLTSRPGIEALQVLRAELGDLWRDGQIIVRFGRASDPDDLARVDITNAAVVIVPQVEATQGDARASTILAAINHTLIQSDSPSPLIITEFRHSESINVLKAFPKLSCEPVLSHATLTKIMAQSIKHAGLAKVFMELLSHSTGHEIYIRELPEMIGQSWGEIETQFENVIPLGILRKFDHEAELLLDPSTILKENDRPIFMAEDLSKIIISKRKNSELKSMEQALALPAIRSRNILIIGHAQSAQEISLELKKYRDFNATIDVASSIDEMSLINYNKIILLPQLTDDLRADEVDQHTIHNYFMLRAQLAAIAHYPDVLVQLASASAAEAFALEARCDVIVPTLISSHLLAHIGLRRDLGVVFEEVLGSTGALMTMFAPHVYGISTEMEFDFLTLRQIVRAQGHVLLGVRIAVDEIKHRRTIELAPKSNKKYKLNHHDRLIILHS